MSSIAVVEIEATQTPASRHGLTARELLDRRADSQRWITASALERWLVESGFAELNDDCALVPTQLAIEVARGIELLGSWRSS